jgi:hypothetical protein
VRHRLGQAARVGDDHRGSRGHGLEGREAEGLVVARDHGDRRPPVELVAGAVVEVAGEVDPPVEAHLRDAPAEVALVGPGPGDDKAGRRTPVEDGREGVQKGVHALLPHQAPDEEDDVFPGLGEVAPTARAGPGLSGRRLLARLLGRLHLLRRDAVGDDPHLVLGELELSGQLGLHVAAAADDPPGLVGQPPLDLADVPLPRVVDAVVTSGLRGVDGGDEGQALGVLRRPGGEGHEPVVGVDDVERSVEGVPPDGEPHHRLQEAVVQLVDPMEEVG